MKRLASRSCLILLVLGSWFTGRPLLAAEPTENLKHFVRVSPRDSRYFELDNGRPYIPIGLNMIRPPTDDIAGMDDWFAKLSSQGGNYVRIWLGSPFFDVEHAKSGQYDEERAKRIDQLLACARKYGIRVKLCIDSFRHLGEGTQTWAAKPIHLAANGGPAQNTADFFNNPRCREQYKAKFDFFAKRYGDDPIIFGWELWNEMNAIMAGDWHSWTVEMLPELHRRFPRNLCMQSLGSFDRDGGRKQYEALCRISTNDVLQVHRYLDLGAQLEICHGPVDLFAADAVRELLAFDVRKPILLAESGGVEPRHSGPFKHYVQDHDGLILHDVLFAPFFAGAAGPGHIWHWDVYVSRNALWAHFGRFAQAVANLDPPAEDFQPQQVEHPRLRILVLRGKRTVLAWCRDKQDTWQAALAEQRRAETLHAQRIKLPMPSANADSGVTGLASVYDPWTNRRSELKLDQGAFTLPDFRRSIVVRVGSR